MNDGTKVLTYNAENQLKSVTVPGVSASTYDYDYIGRRVKKSVHFLSGSGSDYSVTYVYSGWNKIQETKTVGSTTTVKNFVWGLDLSQSMEGAGGIGGLLAVVDGSGSASLFAYDGNGNVSELINSSGGSTQAHYEYDGFGNEGLATGALAQENTFRFSTKQIDPQTGLYDFGYRPYSPELGRWVGRDPIGERGGKSLYAFARNAPNTFVDPLGLNLYAIDGTGNTYENESNVRYFYEYYSPSNGPKWYFPGVGTSGSGFKKWGDSAGGFGAYGIVADVLTQICEDRKADGNAPVDLVGFSRGSAIAVIVANLLNQYGCGCGWNWLREGSIRKATLSGSAPSPGKGKSVPALSRESFQGELPTPPVRAHLRG